LLCLSLITQPSIANNQFSDMRSMPFIEMMVTMIKIMNRIMGGSQYFPSMMPYSPAFMPGVGMDNGLSNMPLGSSDMNGLPINMNTMNSPWQNNNFQTGQNSNSLYSNNLWGPENRQSTVSFNNNTLNGIWQASTGEVFAIYKNNHFLWSDGNARNLAGRLAIKGNKMIAYIPANKTRLYFQFYKEANRFIVRDQSSQIYAFRRIH
jgi:hypothetical protein